MTAVLNNLAAWGAGFPEYKVKAEMVFRIAEFVDWPSGTFARPGQTFIIGIAGKDPFGNFLSSKARTEKIHGISVEIKPFDPNALPGSFHLVFISQSDPERIAILLKKIAGHPILSVSDGDGFSRDGIHVGFLMVDERIRFNINLDAVKKSRLAIPASLLRLAARIIREGGK